MTPAEMGAIAIVLAFLAYFTGRFPTLRSVALFAGILLIGISGHIISIATGAFALLESLTNSVTAWAFGIAVPALLAIVLGYFVIHDWHPKNKAGKRTFWMAGILAVAIAAGATNITALNNLQTSVRTGVTQTVHKAGG